MARSSKVKRKPLFAQMAVTSFDNTFRAIFNQANEEVSRLSRINAAMLILENNLLDPERISQMDTMQQIALLELISRNQQTAIRNVLGFSGTLTKVRSLVAIHDGIKTTTKMGDDYEEELVVTGRLLDHDPEMKFLAESFDEDELDEDI